MPFVTLPPPSYESIINQQVQPSTYNEVNINQQPVQPPSYNEIPHSSKITPSKKSVVTTQPDSLDAKAVRIDGINLGEPLAKKNISNIVLSDNYLAFSQVTYDAYSSCLGSLVLNNIVTVLNTNATAPNNTLLTYESKLIAQSITFSPDNQTISILFTDNQHSELSLFSTDPNEYNSILTNNLFTNKTNVNIPTEKAHSISYDQYGNLYLVGEQDQLLFLWVITFDSENKNTNWQKVTPLNSFANSKTSFSKDGEFLFVLQQDKTLKIFANDNNWLQINSIPEIESLPLDIDSTNEFMVFMSNKYLLLHGIKTSVHTQVESNEYITTACFIPGTKDLFAFDISNKMTLVKYNDSNWNLNNNESTQLNVMITQANFTSHDHTKLITFYISDEDFSANHAPKLATFVWCGGCVGGYLKSYFNSGLSASCHTKLCWQNIGIGIGASASIALGLICLLSCKQAVNKCVAAGQAIDTNILTIKKPDAFF